MSKRSKNANIVYDSEFNDRYIRQLMLMGYEAPTKDEAQDQIRAMFTTLKSCLTEGLSVSRQGFGRFELRYRKSRWGRNPQTGDRIQLPSMISVGFRPGVQLRRVINDKDSGAYMTFDREKVLDRKGDN